MTFSLVPNWKKPISFHIKATPELRTPPYTGQNHAPIGVREGLLGILRNHTVRIEEFIRENKLTA